MRVLPYILLLVSLSSCTPSKEKKTPSSFTLSGQQRIEYKVGNKIAYSGIVRDSMIGPYVYNRDVQPAAVHLDHKYKRQWDRNMMGKRVTVTGVLQTRMIGSDDPKAQIPRQHIFYMDQYDIVIQGN
ncbi:MAG: hypothetical protein NT106_07565 [Candidatus Sumerlaeota bacterium]|nr:hypothetical protein [Candidatus Sumerlaeota bacterium]